MDILVPTKTINITGDADSAQYTSHLNLAATFFGEGKARIRKGMWAGKGDYAEEVRGLG